MMMMMMIMMIMMMMMMIIIIITVKFTLDQAMKAQRVTDAIPLLFL